MTAPDRDIPLREIPTQHYRFAAENAQHCPECGRYCTHESGYGDHETQGCDQRNSDYPHCDCAALPFCSEACADRWHAQGSR